MKSGVFQGVVQLRHNSFGEVLTGNSKRFWNLRRVCVHQNLYRAVGWQACRIWCQRCSKCIGCLLNRVDKRIE